MMIMFIILLIVYHYIFWHIIIYIYYYYILLYIIIYYNIYITIICVCVNAVRVFVCVKHVLVDVSVSDYAVLNLAEGCWCLKSREAFVLAFSLTVAMIGKAGRTLHLEGWKALPISPMNVYRSPGLDWAVCLQHGSNQCCLRLTDHPGQLLTEEASCKFHSPGAVVVLSPNRT